MPGRVPGPLPEHRHTASRLHLAFGVLAEPSRSLHSRRSSRPSSPGTSSLAGCPSPDGTANVHSQRSEDLLRSVGATPPISLRPRGFSPPRRLPPFAGSGMLQPVPGLGSPGFPPGRSSKPKLLGTGPGSSLALTPAKVWRATPRGVTRSLPRRQPFRITAVCSPPAVRRSPDLAVRLASLRPRLAATWGFERFVPASPTSTFPSRPPGLRSLTSGAPSASWLGVAPRLERRASWNGSSHRSPGAGSICFGSSRDDPGGSPIVSSAPVSRLFRFAHRLSTMPSTTAPRGHPMSRGSDRPRALLALGPIRWWVSAPTPHLQVRHRSRRPLALRFVALCPRPGRLQGLSPPTSPRSALPLPAARNQFLPWVCFPFEALPPPPLVPSLSRGSDPASGLRLGRESPEGEGRDGRPGASVRGGSDHRCR